MPEQNESAASAALEDTSAAAEAAEVKAETPIGEHPQDEAVEISGVTEAELQTLRDQALSDDMLSKEEIARVQSAINLSNEQARAESEGMADRTGSGSYGMQQAPRFVGLGDTVYYGDGTGQVWPAIVTHIYTQADDPLDTRLTNNVTAAPGNLLDLQVFKRQHICSEERVIRHEFEPPRALNGWIFKA